MEKILDKELSINRIKEIFNDSGLIDSKMSQPMVIDHLLKCSENYEKTIKESEEIQKKYERYFAFHTKETLDDFVLYTTDFFHKYVSRKIVGICAHKEDADYESYHLIRDIVEHIIDKLDNGDRYIDNIGGYIRTSLDNKIADMADKKEKEKKFLDPRPLIGDDETEKEKKKSLLDKKEDETFLGFDERILVFIYDRLLKLYCSLMMTLEEEPPKQLALCYSRVLSHIDYEASEKVAIATQWAMGRMSKKSISSLGKESEKEIQYKIDRGLAWGESFRERIKRKELVKDKEQILGEIIFVDAYDSVNVERWSRSYHDRIVKSIRKEEAKKDKEFFSLIKDCVENSDILRHFVNYEKEEER